MCNSAVQRVFLQFVSMHHSLVQNIFIMETHIRKKFMKRVVGNWDYGLPSVSFPSKSVCEVCRRVEGGHLWHAV